MKSRKMIYCLWIFFILCFVNGCDEEPTVLPTAIPQTPAPSAIAVPRDGVDTSISAFDEKGSALLTISYKKLKKYDMDLCDSVTLVWDDQTLTLPICEKSTDVDLNFPYVKIDKKQNQVFLSMHLADFQKKYNLNPNTTLTIFLDKKEGYKDTYEAHQLIRTDKRSDYDSDAAFSNYHIVETTGLRKGILCRSGNPFWRENQPLRPQYGDKLAKKTRVRTVINFANSSDEIQDVLNSHKSNSSYYINLFDNNQVFCKHSTADLTDDTLIYDMTSAIRFILSHDGPYLVHCNDGKDRTGLFCALLEALTGATLDEITDDYMLSFENYYHVKKGSTQWDIIARGNILTTLGRLFYPELPAEEAIAKLPDTDLAVSTTTYLKKYGMSDLELTKLKTLLCNA